jgi:hypothetical protein
MKPIHVLLHLMGVKKIILGSTGHSGRDAAELLVGYLRMGYSTVVNPDGPGGPAFALKKGVLHLSLKSNVPIVPLQFSSSSCMLQAITLNRHIRYWQKRWDENVTCTEPPVLPGLVQPCLLAPSGLLGRKIFSNGRRAQRLKN